MTAEDLARYLFGDQMDPNDTGLIGRIIREQEALRAQLRGMLRLGWAILIVLLTSTLAFIGNLLMHVIPMARGGG